METISYETDDRIAYITLDRPEVKNTFNRTMLDELAEVWEIFSEDDDADVAILTGAGDDFCAGADLEDEMDLITDLNNEQLRRRMSETTMGFGRKKDVYKPIIGAIDGWCTGGALELILYCDIRVAGHDAKFGAFNIREGIPYADGGSVLLPLVVGLGNAMELALTGKYASAEKAKEMDLVNRVAEPDQTVKCAEKYAEMMLNYPASGLRGQKETILETIAGGNLKRALDVENYIGYSFHDSEAWQTLPSEFVEEGFQGDIEDRKESLEEAFSQL